MKPNEDLLRETLDVLRIERQELAAILNLKKTCPEAMSRYVARLARREKAEMNSFHSLPDSGITLITGKAKIKYTTRTLGTLQHEINNIQMLYDTCGQQMADIQAELRRTPTMASQRSSAILPKEN